MTAPSAPPSGWYPDPNDPSQERWWDRTSNTWGEWTRPVADAAAPAQTVAKPAAKVAGIAVGGSKRSWVLLAAAAAAVGLWFTGMFDEPLSAVGLQHGNCAENAFGNKMCNDELLEFCKRSYDAEINGDVCTEVLRDEGIDPASLEDDDAFAIDEPTPEEEAAKAQKETDEEAKTDDESIQGDLEELAIAVETCFADTQDYAKCRSEDSLGFIDPLVGSRVGEVEVAAGSGQGYKLVGHSQSGTAFTIDKVAGGGPDRTCSAPGRGACLDDGSW